MSARAGRAASAMSSAMLWRMGLRRLRVFQRSADAAASWRVVSLRCLLLQRVDVGLALCCAVAHVRLSVPSLRVLLIR